MKPIEYTQYLFRFFHAHHFGGDLYELDLLKERKLSEPTMTSRWHDWTMKQDIWKSWQNLHYPGVDYADYGAKVPSCPFIYERDHDGKYWVAMKMFDND